MFSCTVCGREYANRNSLTRHSHNHKNVERHACSICGTVFFRKDLLSRHSKIHEVPDSHASSVSPSAGAAERQRSHTACNECRAGKIKCDGQNPCYTCNSTNKQCSFAADLRHASGEAVDSSARQPRKRSRLSHTASTIRGSISSSQEKNLPVLEPSDVSYQSNSSAVTENLGSGFSHLGSSTFHGPSFHDVDTFLDHFWTESLSVPTSWPWIHADLFQKPETTTTDSEAYFDPENNFYLENQPSVETVPFMVPNQSDDHIQHPVPHNETSRKSPRTNFAKCAATSTSLNDCENHSRILQQTETPPDTISPTTHSDGFEDQRQTPDARSAAQAKITEELIQYSFNPETLRDCRKTRSTYWRTASMRLQEIFAFYEDAMAENVHVLGVFIELYLKHFGKMWPLFPQQTFDPDTLHPALYLTLTSIGAMYGGTKECQYYGAMLHERIRKALLVKAVEIDDVAVDSLWLIRTMLLTQVTVLWFGQKRAFSYAQSLGSMMLVHARRLNLFSADIQHASEFGDTKYQGSGEGLSADERFSKWLHQESKKRLAFGILRSESYTSLILNIQPLISSEEMHLRLPYNDRMWQNSRALASHDLEALEADKEQRTMLFCDLVQVALERNEDVPRLEPLGLELLLFGFQYTVWRFCRDPFMFQRLIAYNEESYQPERHENTLALNKWPNSSQSVGITFSGPERRLTIRDPLEHMSSPERPTKTKYAMNDLHLDRDRLFLALRDWKVAFDAARTSTHLLGARSSILSSLLLYHITHLKLSTPVDDLLLISHQLASGRGPPQHVIDRVCEWSQSPTATTSVEHVSAVWSILSHESQRPVDSRAQLNFLAFTALHFAVVIVWALASMHTKDAAPEWNTFLVTDAESGNEKRIRVCFENLQILLDLLIRLFETIAPAPRWLSFISTAISLKRIRFPLPTASTG